MKNEKRFKRKDLKLCDYQYQIVHTNTKMFKAGQVVFLKSNPEIEMIVLDVKEKTVTVMFEINEKKKVWGKTDLQPECILQYKYAGLLIVNKKINVCLN